MRLEQVLCCLSPFIGFAFLMLISPHAFKAEAPFGFYDNDVRVVNFPKDKDEDEE